MALETNTRCGSELRGQGTFENRQARQETWSADIHQDAELFPQLKQKI